VQSQLPGFYDPCVGEEKSLLVHYLFHSHVHEVVVQDNECLRIPKQCKYPTSWDCSIYPQNHSHVLQQRPKYLHESRLHMKKCPSSRVGTKKIKLFCRSPFLSSLKNSFSIITHKKGPKVPDILLIPVERISTIRVTEFSSTESDLGLWDLRVATINFMIIWAMVPCSLVDTDICEEPVAPYLR
jgi:hypothetical protein